MKIQFSTKEVQEIRTMMNTIGDGSDEFEVLHETFHQSDEVEVTDDAVVPVILSQLDSYMGQWLLVLLDSEDEFGIEPETWDELVTVTTIGYKVRSARVEWENTHD